MNVPALEDIVNIPSYSIQKIKMLGSHYILPEVSTDKLHTMCAAYYVCYPPKKIFMISLTQNNTHNTSFLITEKHTMYNMYKSSYKIHMVQAVFTHTSIQPVLARSDIVFPHWANYCSKGQ